MLLMKIVDIQS